MMTTTRWNLGALVMCLLSAGPGCAMEGALEDDIGASSDELAPPQGSLVAYTSLYPGNELTLRSGFGEQNWSHEGCGFTAELSYTDESTGASRIFRRDLGDPDIYEHTSDTLVLRRMTGVPAAVMDQYFPDEAGTFPPYNGVVFWSVADYYFNNGWRARYRVFVNGEGSGGITRPADWFGRNPVRVYGRPCTTTPDYPDQGGPTSG